MKNIKSYIFFVEKRKILWKLQQPQLEIYIMQTDIVIKGFCPLPLKGSPSKYVMAVYRTQFTWFVEKIY